MRLVQIDYAIKKVFFYAIRFVHFFNVYHFIKGLKLKEE